SEPGIERRRRGKGFEYLEGETGEKITEPEVLARIKELSIPPAWKDVWICPYPLGHIQATGIDAARRKQYIYHQKWRERKDQAKFDHMLDFARALPKMRWQWNQHLALRNMGMERVLACAARLLDLGFFRIGTEGYAEQNDSYGLATMQKRHVTLNGGTITFDYKAKSGKRQIQTVVDTDVYAVVDALKKRRGGGAELLAYKAHNRWVDVKSNDINDYLKSLTGEVFTAKDFRTWNATVLAAVSLVPFVDAKSKTARNRAVSQACKDVARYMGNTPAVCRASYIDPRVFDRFRSGWTIAPALEAVGVGAMFGELETQQIVEEAVLDLIEDRLESEMVEKTA
ncbi:MAG TPA: DNA topoisomerase IB, partial [Actinomycetota bacterium]|nr:DNA topoisomerase IB [Actinomycetota bacterium]